MCVRRILAYVTAKRSVWLAFVLGISVTVGAIAFYKSIPRYSNRRDAVPGSLLTHEVRFIRYNGPFKPYAPGSLDSFIAVGPDNMAGPQKTNVSEKLKIHDARVRPDGTLDTGRPPLVVSASVGGEATINGLYDRDDATLPFLLSLNTLRHRADFWELDSANLEFPDRRSRLDPSGQSYVMIRAFGSADLNTPTYLYETPVRENAAGIPYATGPSVPIAPPTAGHPIIILDKAGKGIASVLLRTTDNVDTAQVLPTYLLETVDGEHVLEFSTSLDNAGQPRFFTMYSHFGDDDQLLGERYGRYRGKAGYLGNELYRPGCQMETPLHPQADYVDTRPIRILRPHGLPI